MIWPFARLAVHLGAALRRRGFALQSKELLGLATKGFDREVARRGIELGGNSAHLVNIGPPACQAVTAAASSARFDGA